MSSQELVSHPCSHFHVNAVYAGWALFTGWTMDASPKDLLHGELPTHWGKAQWPPPATL